MSYMSRIKQFRTKNKITQQNIADTLGITQQQWFKYEKEVNELPIRYLETICKVYGISANWLLGLTEEPETL